jgi:hypothetical protein
VTFAKVDLRAMAARIGVNLDEAFAALDEVYALADQRISETTRELDLPCHRGCSMCCKDAVFLTPLEFFRVWDFVQTRFSEEARARVIERALALHREHREIIEAFDRPPPEGESDHGSIAAKLHFVCPLLGEQGECTVYEARELYARLFGASFNEEGGVYGCHLVGAHLAGKTVTLLRARQMALRMAELPMTFKRQVYPYYVNWLYGGA